MRRSHLFLSPHLDDVAFSCAGLISSLVSNQERVVIATLVTGDAPHPLTPLAQRFHAVWSRGENPYATRRAEDEAAAKFLGAECRHEGLLDAIYRTDESGCPIYRDIAEMFAGVKPIDAANITAIQQRVSRLVADVAPDLVYGPIGIGRHADHLALIEAVKRVCLGAQALKLYEEFPYLLGEFPAENPITVELGLELSGWPNPVAELVDVELTQRISTARCYPSQIGEIFGDDAAMVATMQRHAEHYGARSGRERIWTPQI